MACIHCGKDRTKQLSRDEKDKNQESDEEECCLGIDKEFCESTTCHGLSYWSTSTSNLLRVFWILFVLGMVGGMTYQVYDRINSYLKFEATTDIKRQYASEVDFPSITICNYNRLFSPRNNTELLAMHGLNKVVSSEYLHFLQSMGQTVNPEETSYFNDITNFTISDYYYQNGYDLAEINTLLYCRYNYQPCNITEFTPVVTSYGKCWTFNADISDDSSKKQYVAGSIQGLQIYLNIKQYEYTEDALTGNQEAGIRFQVHNKHEPPNVLKYGLGVPSNRKAFASIQRTDHNIIDKPWGQCDSVNQKTLKYFSSYTLENCLQECYTDFMIKKCNCSTFTQYWARDYAPECTIEQSINCSTIYTRQVEQLYTPEDCGCTIPCFYTDYKVTTSYATAPSNNIANVYAMIVNATSVPNFIQDTSLALDIGFEYIGYVVETQAKALDESSLLSEIGGQLGLWIGMSFVTIMEFVQYFARRTCVCMTAKGRKKGRRVKRVSSTIKIEAWENGGYTEKM